MLNNILGSHINDVQNALSRTTQRQALLTANLANENVPGYKRQDVDFHVALQDQIKGSLSQAEIDQKDRTSQAQSDATSIRTDGNNVDEEREVTGIAETSLHYSALTAMAEDYFSGLKSVIHEGRAG
jgi:flagellar basal-body rod protein FlgB